MTEKADHGRGGFGAGRRAGIAIGVAITIVLAIVVFVLVNWIATRAQFRTSIDATRTARFTISDDTKALVDEVRTAKKKLRITTFFQSPQEYSRHPDVRMHAIAPIQSRCVELTRDLLRRLSYLGGDAVEVVHEDVYGADFGGRAKAESLDGSILNSVRLQIGDRTRGLGLLQDLADIEFPQPSQGSGPAQLTQPVLRAYRGESVLASAISGLLREEGLIAYWLSGHLEAELQDVSGSGVTGFARALRSRGFTNRRLTFDTAAQVPSDCSLLVIPGPEIAISRKAAAAIDSYLRRGGRVLLTLPLPSTVLPDSTIPNHRNLLEPYGVSVSDKWLWNGVPDPVDAKNYRFGTPECARIVIQGTGLSAKHPVSARLRELDLSVVLHRARAIEISGEAGDVRAQYFLSTNPMSFERDLPRGDSMPSLALPDKESLATRHCGVAIEFPRANDDPGNAARSATAGRLVVLGGLALRNGGDAFLARYGGAESVFTHNERLGVLLADWLVRQDEKVGVAPTAYRASTMDVPIPQLERADFWLVKALPIAFLVLACCILFWRRRA
ncbi:MAG: Gldg family protein [Planctomycetes bacterium]|nr:Gldg family protein [Planctomycetota bacterium]